MFENSIPCEQNLFLAEHVDLMRECLRRYTGKDLVDPLINRKEGAREVFYAPFAVVSHNTSEDPVFNYANRTALGLFEMKWEEIVRLPSRLSAEPPEREERARLLNEVTNKGYIDHYSGIRISKRGKRFLIEKALVWNLIDRDGKNCGQAATFSNWKYI